MHMHYDKSVAGQQLSDLAKAFVRCGQMGRWNMTEPWPTCIRKASIVSFFGLHEVLQGII